MLNSVWKYILYLEQSLWLPLQSRQKKKLIVLLAQQMKEEFLSFLSNRRYILRKKTFYRDTKSYHASHYNVLSSLLNEKALKWMSCKFHFFHILIFRFIILCRVPSASLLYLLVWSLTGNVDVRCDNKNFNNFKLMKELTL